MTTINQYRFKKKKFKWSPSLGSNPQLRGRILKILITTPRKPNSALRKVARVTLSNKKKIFAKILGSGSIPQKYSIVLVRGKGYKDTPSVKYSILRGVYDCLPLYNKNFRRSIYGSPNKNKIHIRKSLRR